MPIAISAALQDAIACTVYKWVCLKKPLGHGYFGQARLHVHDVRQDRGEIGDSRHPEIGRRSRTGECRRAPGKRFPRSICAAGTGHDDKAFRGAGIDRDARLRPPAMEGPARSAPNALTSPLRDLVVADPSSHIPARLPAAFRAHEVRPAHSGPPAQLVWLRSNPKSALPARAQGARHAHSELGWLLRSDPFGKMRTSPARTLARNLAVTLI